jgi:hypothetical protein
MRDQLVSEAPTYAIHNKQKRQKIHTFRWIRTRNPSNQAANLGHMTTRIDKSLTYYRKSFSYGRNLGADFLVHQVTTSIKYETCLNNITGLQPTSGPGSVIGIATGYGLGGPGIESR